MSDTSPIQRLPAELILHAFTMALEELGERGYAPTNPSPTDLPWSLTKVCRLWRKLAIDYPRLWTHMDVRIDLVYGSMTPRFANDPVSLLRTALERSGRTPLHICYADPNPRFYGWRGPRTHSYTDLVTAGDTLFTLLIVNANRWRKAELRLSRPHISVLRSVRGYLPMLRSITLDTSDIGDDGHITNIPLDAFELAPSLEVMKVDMNFNPRAFIPLHLKPVLPSLTTFSDHRTCTFGMWPSYFAVLSTPSIRICEIRFQEIAEGERQELVALPPGKQWISPVEDFTMCCDLLLRHLTLPNLQAMTLGYNGECFVQARDFLPTFRDVLTRSKSPLTHLCLCNIVEDETILEVVPTIGTLKDVSFVGSSLDTWTWRYSQIIQDLIVRLQTRTYMGSGFDVLPRLESFDVTVYDCRDKEDLFFINKTFVDMVVDRARNGHLRSVNIFGVLPTSNPRLEGLAQDGVEELRKLRQELGMVIDISVESSGEEDAIRKSYI
ncbi:hypothetical protein BDZ89DRAFT_1166258 [Hymenopellis radicata]|nr:hypothetical protein BDZ89DRAFT_1166258 [Hymenopellis radicata]